MTMPTGKKITREIKFRGRSKIYSKTYIYFKLQDIQGAGYSNNDKDTVLYIKNNPFHTWNETIDIKTIEQYTGLLDKNGTEIYEGDILKDFAHYPISYQHKLSNQQGIAVFSVEMGGYYILPENNDNIPINAETLQEATSKNYEVIGNVWEDGDL